MPAEPTRGVADARTWSMKIAAASPRKATPRTLAAPPDDDSTLPGSRRTVDEPSGPITMEVVVASTLAVDVGADFDAGDSLLHAASNSTTAVKGAKHRPVTWVILAWCDHLHRRCP